jgi:nitronate monooxygenase
MKFSDLRLPVMVAPMFIVSGVQLVIECCKAGIIGSFPALNGRTSADFAAMLEAIEAAEKTSRRFAPYAVNITMRIRGTERFDQDLALLRKHKVPLIITSVGNPGSMVEEVHSYGGLVFHDVANLRHARIAADAGVDGIIVVCAGAGGHAGVINPFAFVPQVRQFYDGMIGLAGAISTGEGVLAAQALGADFAYMGTRFIATAESDADPGYKEMLVTEETHNIMHTNALSSVPANFMKSSIIRAGLDPDNLPAPKGLWKTSLPEGIKAWRDVWSAGQGVGAITDVPSVENLVSSLVLEYETARAKLLN